MRALVTGATGFVGGHLVEALVRRGDEVTALVRSPGKAAPLERLGVRLVSGDLHRADALAEAVRNQDVVYHVAGLVAARTGEEFFRANREGTENLVAALRRFGPPSVRLVLVSSLAAAGPAERGRPLTGAEPPRPVTTYGRSKLAAEEAVMASDLDWRIVRPPMVYGPRDTEVFKVFRLARRGVVPVFGDGSQELSAIFGPDLAEALVAVGLSPAARGRIYHACHPEIFTSRQFVLAVAAALREVGAAATPAVRLLPLPRPVALGALALTAAAAWAAGKATILTPDKAAEFFQPAWTGDPGPLMHHTGWAPQHDLTLGLGVTARWYREHGWL
jgi:nucleoside-diphosphate-sugar epimerase